MDKSKLKNSIQSIIMASTIILGGILFIFAVLPGDFSPLRTLQYLANRFAGDGAFNLHLVIYQRIQKFALPTGLALLLVGCMIYIASRKKSDLYTNLFIFGILVLYLMGGIFVVNLLIDRSDSFAYRQIFGAPPTPTITPFPTITPEPSPTPKLEGPGSWIEYVEGLSQPVAVVSPPDGSNRLFVVEKTGWIRIIKDRELLPTPFLDLQGKILEPVQNYEQGFLGMTFHPQYAENGYFYVSYVDPLNNAVISRYQVSDDPNRADPNSEFKILAVFRPNLFHYGGTIKFGPDGYFYISSGDGDFRAGAAQSLDTFYGKILRIDVDHGNPYSIPPSNPFVNQYGRDEIFVYGLRNPWQFTFDPLTHDLYIGDVGDSTWEEIDFLPAGHPGGLNYGWKIKEGSRGYHWDIATLIPAEQLTDPIWEYEQNDFHCTVISGEVYRGSSFPSLVGWYIFGDFCSGFIWGLHQTKPGEWEHKILYDLRAQITSFGADENGELYFTDFIGRLWKLSP